MGCDAAADHRLPEHFSACKWVMVTPLAPLSGGNPEVSVSKPL